MNFLNDIKEKTIIICENNYKEIILKEMSKNHLFLDVSFLTKKNFLKEYLYNYDEKALYYLVSKYHLKVEIAKMYLDNIIFINDSVNYTESKLQFLIKLKKELIKENLLIFNNSFKEIVKQVQILIIGYSYIEPFELNILNTLKVKYLDKESNYTLPSIYEFKTQEDEVNFVCKSISQLLCAGIDINNIKIVGINKDYYNTLERISSFYNIPINIPSENNLYSHIVTKKFLSNINTSVEAGLEVIKDENEELVYKIINICNKYTFIDDLNIFKKLIIYEFKNTKIDNFQYQNYIEIKDINSIFSDNEYVFFLNFNNGSNPITYKDEEYITDNIKDILGLTKTNLINKSNKEYLIKKLMAIKNLTISYKLNDQNGECYPSSIISDLNLKVIKYEFDDKESYSYTNDLINYTKCLDNYDLYGIISSNLSLYQNSFGNINYKSFNNKFKGINKNSLEEYLHNHLTLSYSSLSNYNKCAFRYFIANILKLDKYEENFEAFLGSLFHDVLEKCLAYNLIVEEEIEAYIKRKEKVLSIKERFFVNKIINDIKFVIMALKRQQNYINLDKVYYEKNIRISKNANIQIEFTGYIDKILYKENDNETLVAIIDYKTGNIDIDLKYLPYGLSLQLPVYLYLVKKSNLFKNPKFVGFYLQYILEDITINNNLTYEEQKLANLKLMGYSTTNEHYLSEFDSNYQNSELIKGMKVTSKGEFGAYTKVLTEKEINKIINLTEDNINKSIDKIINGDFAINPKRIGYDNVLGCQYCKFNDICFHKDEDYITLPKIENLDFLKEENYAEVD